MMSSPIGAVSVRQVYGVHFRFVRDEQRDAGRVFGIMLLSCSTNGAWPIQSSLLVACIQLTALDALDQAIRRRHREAPLVHFNGSVRRYVNAVVVYTIVERVQFLKEVG